MFAFDGYAADKGGWIANQLKAIDFAGGTAVHINAGAAGLALALVLGKRIGFGKEPMRPHNLTLVMIGAGLLWFGWFGFNAGSALGANGTAAITWVNTLAATGAACSPGWPPSGSATDTPPPSARPPASSPAWSPSPRPAPRSRRSVRSRSASSAACSAPWRWG